MEYLQPCPTLIQVMRLYFEVVSGLLKSCTSLVQVDIFGKGWLQTPLLKECGSVDLSLCLYLLVIDDILSKKSDDKAFINLYNSHTLD